MSAPTPTLEFYDEETDGRDDVSTTTRTETGPDRDRRAERRSAP
jgi:hypothetical protein